MEVRLVQTRRPNEIKKATKTPEERREIQVRVAAARLQKSESSRSQNDDNIALASSVGLYSESGWPLSDDTERAKLLEKIFSIFQVLKYLGASHVNKEFSNSCGIGRYSERSIPVDDSNTEAENLNVSRFAIEKTYSGVTSALCDFELGEDDDWRTKDYLHQVDSCCIEVAMQRQKEQFATELSNLDAMSYRNAAARS
ncbi:ubiquitin carboxyl-terminal hydrolase-related protein [Actinidia rufa]|uniref:Ubiquitin carboxyl-terminal hydrolase-related protein n=1 Tax=Actinidia rufa TaxID=165716 RepID=A0A7J0F2S5_9ERIC|nr:ubiquitin carboxyl-terminal hydrolase-related protein [Actinidia rufa]